MFDKVGTILNVHSSYKFVRRAQLPEGYTSHSGCSSVGSFLARLVLAEPLRPGLSLASSAFALEFSPEVLIWGEGTIRVAEVGIAVSALARAGSDRALFRRREQDQPG